METFEVGSPEYIASGGNRHPAAADWDRDTGLLAFGTDRNIALWNPEVSPRFNFLTIVSLCEKVRINFEFIT